MGIKKTKMLPESSEAKLRRDAGAAAMSAAVGKSIVDYAGERIRGMQRHEA